MENREDVRAFLCAYAKRRPGFRTDDLIKLLYQSAFGCGHFAPDQARVLSFLEQEAEGLQAADGEALVEPILGGYARVYLTPYAAQGMGMETLARLFMRTANETPREGAKAWFEEALSCLEALAQEGALPLDAKEVGERLRAYRAAGCPALHHSEAYRERYHPAYRVLRAEYARFLPVFARIDALLLGKERVIAAIDGNSGSGKSTLASLLAQEYAGATLVHMDDFFLQAHQRTPQRFAQPGGNVDSERFLEEVLAPMRRGEAFCYRPFDCSRMEIGEGRMIKPGKLCIVEGSYSLHPALSERYDLAILLRIDAQEQVRRIRARNGEAMLARFVSEWIPMENLYFDATRIEERCDLCIQG